MNNFENNEIDVADLMTLAPQKAVAWNVFRLEVEYLRLEGILNNDEKTITVSKLIELLNRFDATPIENLMDICKEIVKDFMDLTKRFMELDTVSDKEKEIVMAQLILMKPVLDTISDF